jgi:type I restriction enzyme, R subunit
VSKNDPRAAKARTIAASHHAGRTENEKNPQTSKFFSKLLEELEKILIKAAGAPSPHIAAAKEHGLGLFIRALIGLDREAAKEAFASFPNGKLLSANQIEFINLIIDHLTEHGIIEAERLYESPFTDLNPRGVEGLFDTAQVNELLSVISNIRAAAA